MEHKGHKDCATFCQFLPFQWFSYRNHRCETIAVLFPTADLLVFTQQTDYTHPAHVLSKSRLWNYKKIPHKMNIKKNIPTISNGDQLVETVEMWKLHGKTFQPRNPGNISARCPTLILASLDAAPPETSLFRWGLKSQPGVGSLLSHLFMRVFDHYQVDWWIHADLDIYNHVYIYIYICIYNLYIVQYMYTGLTLGLKSQNMLL